MTDGVKGADRIERSDRSETDPVGASKIRRRTVMVAAGGVCAFALATVAVVVGLAAQRDDGQDRALSPAASLGSPAPAPSTGSAASTPDGSVAATGSGAGAATAIQEVSEQFASVTPIERADPVMQWEIVEEPQVGLGPQFFEYSFAGTANPYAVSTMPGRNTEGTMAVYSTADAINWTPASTTPIKNLWLSDLQSGPGAQVYGIGTAPGAKSSDVELVRAYSDDGGATFDVEAFPIDFAGTRKALGSVGTSGSALASNGATTVAALNVIGYVSDPAQILPDGVDAPYGATFSEDGIDIFAEVDEIVAVGERVCPPKWALKQGVPRQWLETITSDGVAVPQPIPGRGGANNEWHCEPAAGSSEEDLYIDGNQVHGDVVSTIPFAELGLSPDALMAMRQQPRLFTSADGRDWAEVSMPVQARGSVEQLVVSGDTFAMTLVTSPGLSATRTLWLSGDGVNWRAGELPSGISMTGLIAAPRGGLMLIGAAGGESVVATSVDGETWDVRSYRSLIGNDPALRLYSEKVVASPAGVMMMVNAFIDPLASKGGAELRHGAVTLRIEDTNQTLTLLDDDGAVLDRTGQDRSGMQTGRGMLRQGIGGFEVVDPQTGDIVTSFGWSEIDAAMREVMPDDERAQVQTMARYVISSVDGEHWAAERLDSPAIGLIGGNNIWVTNAFATDESLVFTFNNGANCCDPDTPPAPPIVLVATPVR